MLEKSIGVQQIHCISNASANKRHIQFAEEKKVTLDRIGSVQDHHIFLYVYSVDSIRLRFIWNSIETSEIHLSIIRISWVESEMELVMVSATQTHIQIILRLGRDFGFLSWLGEKKKCNKIEHKTEIERMGEMQEEEKKQWPNWKSTNNYNNKHRGHLLILYETTKADDNSWMEISSAFVVETKKIGEIGYV